ncbi:Protein of unknown function [Lactobacillus helveticus CIRM-BIA 101]|nr:Protein of unknown function [Lactobacillus helveticus CIRM-BIA 101]
MYHKSN